MITDEVVIGDATVVDFERAAKWAVRKYRLPYGEWEAVMSDAVWWALEYGTTNPTVAARNGVAERFRSQEKHYALPLELRDDDYAANSGQERVAIDESGYASVEFEDTFREMTAGLPRGERDAFWFYVNGFTHDETASVLGVSERTVQKRVERARNRLQRVHASRC